MSELVHADIFFFVTTVVVVVVGAALTVALIYLVMILRRVRDVAEEVKAEAILVREDIHDVRDQVRREGFKFKHFAALIGGFFKKKRSKKA